MSKYHIKMDGSDLQMTKLSPEQEKQNYHRGKEAHKRNLNLKHYLRLLMINS